MYLNNVNLIVTLEDYTKYYFDKKVESIYNSMDRWLRCYS